MKTLLFEKYDHLKRASWLRLMLATALAFTLSGCPDNTTPPPAEKDMAPEEDQSSFTYDLDLPDQAPMIEDMMVEDAEVSVEDLSCSSCEEDDDCGEGSQCVNFGDETGKRCFKLCEDGDEGERCAEGSSCLTLSNDLEVCVSDDDDECELCYDPDNDGYGPGGYCERGNADCEQGSAEINPGARDNTCDGVDDDCDMIIDENYTPTACSEGTCTAESSCVDGVEMECVVPEIADNDSTCDGYDDDCDGSIDEDYTAVSCGEGVCGARSSCVDGTEQACEPLSPEASDDLTCDGIDEDCDGRVDETFTGSCGAGICVRSATCSRGAEICEPRAPEVGEVDASCDNIDQDCDGEVDEGFTTEQTCGFGACQVTGSCVNGGYECTPLPPSSQDDDTCDGVDNDCDGEIDEDCQVNTLRVEYNATLSTATRVALDIYYDQEVSPARVPENYQPTIAFLAIRIPQGMTLDPPFIEGQKFTRSQAVIDSGKTVSVQLPPGVDETNTRQFSIIGLFEPAASSFLRPSADGVGGHLLTIYVDVNGVPAPWNFSWSAPYTQLSPVAAMEVLELTPIAPISP